MGTDRTHDHATPFRVQNAGNTLFNSKKRGCRNSMENPIGIETNQDTPGTRALSVATQWKTR